MLLLARRRYLDGLETRGLLPHATLGRCYVCSRQVHHPIEDPYEGLICSSCGTPGPELSEANGSGWFDDIDAFGGWSNVVRAYEDDR